MTRPMWLPLCVAALAAASLVPVQPLEARHPPEELPALSLAEFYVSQLQAPGKAPVQAPGKGPIQAPIQAPKAPPPPQVITKTIMVPHTTFKTVTVPQTVLRPEVRQKTVAIPRTIPETHMVTRTITVPVPEVRTRTETYPVCRMEFEVVERPVTVMVPHTEMHQGVKTVCRPVPVQVAKTVCRDMGHWDTKSYVDCHGCVQSCSVWVPNIVTEQVPVTVMKPEVVEVPFQYPVTVCRPETRMVTERIPRPVVETRTREVQFTVPVPRQFEKQVPVTTFRQEVEHRVVNYTEMIPVAIEKTIQVPVCTMVPKTISYTVPACEPCGYGYGYGGGYGPGWSSQLPMKAAPPPPMPGK